MHSSRMRTSCSLTCVGWGGGGGGIQTSPDQKQNPPGTKSRHPSRTKSRPPRPKTDILQDQKQTPPGPKADPRDQKQTPHGPKADTLPPGPKADTLPQDQKQTPGTWSRPPPPRTEFLTHAPDNITSPQLRCGW